MNGLIARTLLTDDATVDGSLDDFPTVSSYVRARFPDLKYDELRILLSSPRAFERAGIRFAAGVFVPPVKAGDKCLAVACYDTAFRPSDRLAAAILDCLDRYASVDLSIDDVLVHELCHYASYRMGTGGPPNAEELFAYGMSAQFYRDRGMQDKQIVRLMAPFFVRNMLRSGSTSDPEVLVARALSSAEREYRRQQLLFGSSYSMHGNRWTRFGNLGIDNAHL